MGKKEQLEVLDKQLKEANLKLKKTNMGLVSLVVLFFGALLFPLLWILVIFVFVMVLITYSSNKRRINEIELEKAKLK